MPPPPEPSAIVPFVNPLAGLSFDDSLNPSAFLAKIEGNVRERMVEHARISVGDAFASAIQTVSLTQKGYYVTFSDTGFDLMRSGDGLKAVQVDAVGRVHELPTIVNDWVGSLSKVTSLVVSVAHIISGADLSRRLKKVESKLTWLDAKIEIGQRAKIHSAYEELRDLLGELHPDKSALRRLRETFREHRVRYIDEAKASLDRLSPFRSERHVEKPRLLGGKARTIIETVGGPVGKIVVVGTDKLAVGYDAGSRKIEEIRTAEGGALHAQRVRELDEVAARIGMAEYCVRLEALVSGALESDYSESCRDCAKTLRKMVAPLANRELEIGTDHRSAAVDGLAEAMAQIGR